jgi:8-oxo-dGTP pyrophosphatase MutT (NUDIX family)
MDLSEAPRPGSPGAPLWDPGAIPAATVVVLRDGAAGLEVLMLHRDRDLSFAGGMWVFPGGRIDPADHPDPTDHPDPSGQPDGTPDLEAAARRAAVREAAEEAGLSIDPGQLRRWSHWTPPRRARSASPRHSTSPLPPMQQRWSSTTERYVTTGG